MNRLSILLLLLAGTTAARAEEPLQDNSFLIEEAYNQERGVVQHINTFSRAQASGDWVYTLTQEWPVPDARHQLSYTLPLLDVHGAAAAHVGVGDVALNYRYGALGRNGERVAFAPRATLLVPTGRSQDGLGTGGPGVQVNLPLSIVVAPKLVTHWNAGATRTFGARDADGARASLNALALGQSVVWLFHPRINVLVETLWTRTPSVAGKDTTARADALFVSPGVRFGHDFASGLQIVPGIAVPIGVGPSRGERSLFVYLSVEHPFRKH
jgi:hypothetical protein